MKLLRYLTQHLHADPKPINFTFSQKDLIAGVKKGNGKEDDTKLQQYMLHFQQKTVQNNKKKLAQKLL